MNSALTVVGFSGFLTLNFCLKVEVPERKVKSAPKASENSVFFLPISVAFPMSWMSLELILNSVGIAPTSGLMSLE